MGKLLQTLLLAAFVAIVIIISYWVGQQAYNWMPAEATYEAKQVDNLFSFLVTVGAFIFFSIFGVIVFSLIFHRANKNDYSPGHPARSDWKIETLWILIPTLLVLWIAWQSYNIYENLLHFQGLQQPFVIRLPGDEPANAATPPISTPQIGVVAKQWAWNFNYPGNVYSNTELHLPVNQSVRLILQSEDVLHGFYVPEFRVKQDIIPNRKITFMFTPLRTGKYRLQDSQFSGRDFALMQADVYVESVADYQTWLSHALNRQSFMYE